MKAEELMIGDWVKRRLDNKNFQIDTIINADETCLLHAPKEGMVFGYMVDPIPLTPEILEKNGFKKTKGYCQYVIDTKCDFIGVGFYNSYFTFVHEHYCVNVDDPIEMEYCQDLEFERKLYVHEFQHLLKLCGIDKEIVL